MKTITSDQPIGEESLSLREVVVAEIKEAIQAQSSGAHDLEPLNQGEESARDHAPSANAAAFEEGCEGAKP